MDNLSKISQTLLKEIIKCNSNPKHFEDYFNLFCDLSKTKYKTEEILRTAFGELEDAGMIKTEWADDVPWKISVTSRGYSYLSEKKKKSIVSFLKWFIGFIVAIAAIVVPILFK